MSGVGFWELILVFLIGLIVLGPERLPRVANQLGTWLGQARRMSRALKRQLEDELNLEKDLNIRPRPAPRIPPPSPAPRDDDTYSPAHAADGPGTGAGSDMRDGDPPSTEHAQSADDQRQPDDHSPATPGAQPGEGGGDSGDDMPSAVGNSKT